MSRRTNETRSSTGARNFGYDPTGQLLQVTHPADTETFSYDSVGNRLSVCGAAGAGSYSSNALNQYTSAVGLGTLTYDANGNLASGGGWTYSHNSNSRLISANGPGGASASFGRDARNREVKRTLNGVTTYHIYDDWNLVAEYNSTGTLTTRYIHGPRVDEVLAKVTSSGSTYPLEDGLGSTIAVTSPTGEVLERISYTDAHGTPTFQTATGTPLPGTTTGTRFLFTGREWLAELGLYDYRNRTYSPTLGRFLQTDPIRFDAGDVNLYRYVTNNPVRYVDPMGTNIIDTIKEWFKGPAKSPEKPMPDPTGWPEVVLPTGYTAACIAARAAYINCLKAQTWDPCNVDCSSAMAHMYRVCDAASKVNEAFQ